MIGDSGLIKTSEGVNTFNVGSHLYQPSYDENLIGVVKNGVTFL